MLKHLFIQNLVLIEQVNLSFTDGLNIITGETGSGKSAIMHSLGLALGERADTSLIRHGCEKGVIEAIFEADHPTLSVLLNEAGVEWESGQEIIIRREVSQTGKGRIFINHQAAQLSFLKQLGWQLVQMVSQHANRSLLSLDYQREILDLFGSLQTDLNNFQSSYDLEKKLRQELSEMIQQEAQRLRERDRCQIELDELLSAQIKEGEEEELFAEYTLLIHAEELSQKISEINLALTGERNPLLPALNRQKQTLESLLQYDPSLKEFAETFQNAFVELREVSHSLQSYQSTLEFNPERLHTINDRLTLLNQLKRKYGQSVEEMLTYQTQAATTLAKLENAEIEIEALRHQLQQVETQTEQMAQTLSAKRKKEAGQFAHAITKHLKLLNMPKAVFTIEIKPQPRSRNGDEQVEFYLCPNIGERNVPLKDGVSGGEISRILLAIQTLLAGKEERETLIFDEVDANIGGETASIVGDRLREIGQNRQVICITHFPQVALRADGHFQIAKEEKEGRTVTLVQQLDEEGKQLELARMAGQKLETSVS